MPDSNRGRESAGQGLSVLIAVAVAFFGLVIWAGYRQDHSDEREYAARDDREQAIASCVGSMEGVADPACVSEAIDAQYHKQHEAADLRAQQEMAEWALLMLFATTAGVVYVALTLETTRQANKAAWAAVKATEDIGKKQVRAYLGIESAKIEPMAGRGCYCFFKLKNYGQSPASGIEVYAKVQFTITAKGEDWPSDKKVFDVICNHPRTLPPGATGRCAVHIQNEMNAISELKPAEIRFYCTARVFWLDVFTAGEPVNDEQGATIVMSQPLGTWTSEHWRNELDVGGSEQSGGWKPRLR